MAELVYQQGRDILDRGGFVRLHREYWIPDPDPHEIGARYSFQNAADLSRRIERAPGGFACALLDNSVSAVVECMQSKTRGYPSEIAPTWSELTGDGTWSTYDNEGNTITLVTFTVDGSKRGEPVGKGRLTDEALAYFLGQYVDMEFRRTYSPLNRKAVYLHLRHGARPLALLRKARPGLYIKGEPAEDAIIFGYGNGDGDEDLLRFLLSTFGNPFGEHANLTSSFAPKTTV